MLSGKAKTNIGVSILVFWEMVMGFDECIVLGESLVMENGHVREKKGKTESKKWKFRQRKSGMVLVGSG